jgi:ubiquitin C-terminal hydrolase
MSFNLNNFLGSENLKVKFREIKRRCRQLVEKYRKVRQDDREFPQFFIHALSEDGSAGQVHLYRKARGKKPYFSKASIYTKA